MSQAIYIKLTAGQKIWEMNSSQRSKNSCNANTHFTYSFTVINSLHLHTLHKTRKQIKVNEFIITIPKSHLFSTKNVFYTNRSERANEPLKSGINLMAANYKCVLNVLLFASPHQLSQIDNQV